MRCHTPARGADRTFGFAVVVSLAISAAARCKGSVAMLAHTPSWAALAALRPFAVIVRLATISAARGRRGRRRGRRREMLAAHKPAGALHAGRAFIQIILAVCIRLARSVTDVETPRLAVRVEVVTLVAPFPWPTLAGV